MTAAHYTCGAAHEEVGMYWHFFPTFEQARRSIWDGYRKDGPRILENVFPGFLDPKRPGSVVRRKDESQMKLELKSGSIWRLMGSDRVESVGAGPKGVVFSEFALCRPTAWDYVRPMLRESGGWAWFLTTPRGRNHAKKLFDAAGPGSGWLRDTRTVYDTGLSYASNRNPDAALTADEMMAEERAEGMEEALIQQEYLCDWSAALVGSVYGDLMQRVEQEGRLAAFEHERDGIIAVFDLGISDDTAIWLFRIGPGGVEFMDHYSNHGEAIEHYFDWLERRGKEMRYTYQKLFLPHDARARSLQTGISILERFIKRYGSGLVAITPELSLVDGIQATRWLLQQPTRIHPRCEAGIDSMRQYHYGFDEAKKVFSRTPVHDWSSHDADAFRYAACVVRRAEGMAPKQQAERSPVARPLSYAFSLDELHELSKRDRQRRRRV